jgi:hypothetical protein
MTGYPRQWCGHPVKWRGSFWVRGRRAVPSGEGQCLYSNPAKGVLNFVVTLTTHKDVRSYPRRSMESAIKLVERFIAGVTKPARPSTPEAETNPHQYDGPPRTAEQVAAWVRHPRFRSGI